MTSTNSLPDGEELLSHLPSAFWLDLKAKNEAMLQESGFQNMKRTVSQNYFNWLITDSGHPFFRFVFGKWLRRIDLIPFRTKLSEMSLIRTYTNPLAMLFTKKDVNSYRRYVSLVWSIMTHEDPLGLRFKVSEPLAGNAIPVMLGNKIISQDLATSIIETNMIARVLRGIKSPRVAEVGAGYGRTAFVYAKTQVGQYFIFDIQPTLSVAEWYLKETLGPENVFGFREFRSFGDIQAELETAKVALFSAEQIRYFPDKYFDLTLSISTLPEMSHKQALFYLSEFQRLSRSKIFLKQWRRWKNPEDGTDLSEDDYKLNSDWRQIFDRTDPIIPDFFNKIWSINGPLGTCHK